MPTIAELEAQLEELKKQTEQLEAAKRREASLVFNALRKEPSSYEWMCYPQKHIDWMTKIEHDAVRVTRRFRPEVIDEFEASHGSLGYGTRDWVGMIYLRTDEGILTHSGGGTMVLNDPMLCSDREWEQLKMGEIAMKYMRF